MSGQIQADGISSMPGKGWLFQLHKGQTLTLEMISDKKKPSALHGSYLVCRSTQREKLII